MSDEPVLLRLATVEDCPLLVTHTPNQGVGLHFDHVYKNFHAIGSVAKFFRCDTQFLELCLTPGHSLASLVECYPNLF